MRVTIICYEAAQAFSAPAFFPHTACSSSKITAQFVPTDTAPPTTSLPVQDPPDVSVATASKSPTTITSAASGMGLPEGGSGAQEVMHNDVTQESHDPDNMGSPTPQDAGGQQNRFGTQSYNRNETPGEQSQDRNQDTSSAAALASSGSRVDNSGNDPAHPPEFPAQGGGDEREPANYPGNLQELGNAPSDTITSNAKPDQSDPTPPANAPTTTTTTATTMAIALDTPTPAREPLPVVTGGNREPTALSTFKRHMVDTATYSSDDDDVFLPNPPPTREQAGSCTVPVGTGDGVGQEGGGAVVIGTRKEEGEEGGEGDGRQEKGQGSPPEAKTGKW